MPSAQRSPRDPRLSATAAPDGEAGSGARRWFSGLTDLFGSKRVDQDAGDGNSSNALLAFPSETGSQPPLSATTVIEKRVVSRPVRLRLNVGRNTVIIASIISGTLIALFLVPRLPILRMRPKPPAPGAVSIDTRPGNLDVLVDGERRGATPLTLSLAPGAHTVTIRNGSDSRVIPLTISPGAEIAQYFEMKAAEPAVVVGRVSIVTDPPGARVSIDGKSRGTSPLTVPDLTAADHKVTVTNDNGSVERTVTVVAGGTASVVFSLPKVSGPVAGWLSVSSPFEVTIAENNDTIGTSGANRIMLAAGRHDLVLTNRALGYQETRKVEVPAGKTATLKIEPPKVSVSVNARPWAEVTLDGNSVGQTPIANLQVSVGPHEVVFRHPQLAERRETVVVTAKGPNRITADLSK